MINNTPGREWEAHNVKRNAIGHIEKSKVDKARKYIGLVQLALSVIALVKQFKKK